MKPTLLAVCLAAVAIVQPSAVWADSTVKVELWDKGAAAEMATDLGYAKPLVNNANASMGVKLSVDSVPAGVVTFEVANASKDTVHELLVMPLDDAGALMPYLANDSKIDETKAGSKGEVSELAFGKTGAVTLTLTPGKYLLVCNIANHYMAGMWTAFTVTK